MQLRLRDEERRLAGRRRLEKCPGTYRTGGSLRRLLGIGRTFHFRAEDCSMVGMKMVARSPIELYRSYTFSFRDPREGHPFHLSGSVVWVEPVTDPTDGSKGWQGGVEFAELGVGQQVALRSQLKLLGDRDREVTIKKTQVRRYYQRGGLD